MRFVLVFCLAAAPSFAATVFGRLVDSNCYRSAQRNVNSKDGLTNVDRDQGMDIRMCYASSKTKSFTIVEPSGMSFMLDAAGDAKAGELLRKIGRHPGLYVNVTGEIAKNMIQVNSVMPAP